MIARCALFFFFFSFFDNKCFRLVRKKNKKNKKQNKFQRTEVLRATPRMFTFYLQKVYGKAFMLNTDGRERVETEWVDWWGRWQLFGVDQMLI